ncbi:Polyketide cyclase / dehydrase and lipid transport [compost metagenome]
MAYNNDNAQAFRTQYRAAIHPLYNPWLHAAFVLAYGAVCLSFFWRRLDQVAAWQWLVVPLALVFFSWGEYQVHKRLGHHKSRLGGLFYKRHTGDHHSFFVEGQMRYETLRDWRVILFPAWLIVLYSLPLFAVWWLLARLDGNLAALFAGSMLLGYLSYEVLHACEHLPDEHPVARLPWVRHMRHLHALHHRRELMQTHNFGIVHPLMDWLYGTLRWEPLEEGWQTTMRHAVHIARPADQVLAYAGTPTRWPEWHPSSLRVYGAEGTLAAGDRFDEDIHAGGRTNHLSWDVLDYQPGRRWQARAVGGEGLELLVTYECTAEGEGTRFVRTLAYRFPGLLLRLANRLVLRRRIERESAHSLEALRTSAESLIPSREQAA